MSPPDELPETFFIVTHEGPGYTGPPMAMMSPSVWKTVFRSRRAVQLRPDKFCPEREIHIVLKGKKPDVAV